MAQKKKNNKKNPSPKQGRNYTPTNQKRSMIVRVVALILCAMMVIGVFSILLYTLAGG